MWNKLKITVDRIVADLRGRMATQHIAYNQVNLFDVVNTLEWIMQEKPHNRLARDAVVVTISDVVADFNRCALCAKSSGYIGLAGCLALAACALLSDSLQYSKKSCLSDYESKVAKTACFG